VLLATHDRELIRNSGRRTITLDGGRVIEEKMPTVERATRSEALFGIG
jgi:ABC-type ATPase involved in cell division